MTEENTAPEGVADENDAIDPLSEEAFDLFGLIEEDYGFPEGQVEIRMNEKAAHEHMLNMRKLAKLDAENPEHHALMRKLIDETKALEEKIDASKITLHLRGFASDRLEEAREITDGIFEPKKKQRMLADKSIQRYLPQNEQLEWAKYFNALANSMHVTKVVDHLGREHAAPGVDWMYSFLAKGPESQRKKFLAAVQELKVPTDQFEARLDDSFFPKS